MGQPNQTWRGSSPSVTYPLLLGEVDFTAGSSIVIDSETTTMHDGVRLISTGASGSEVASLGGGTQLRKRTGTGGVRLAIPLADLGFVAGYARRPLILVSRHPDGLGKSDTASGMVVGFTTSETAPTTGTVNYHGASSAGQWFTRSQFGGSGAWADPVGVSGAPFPADLSPTLRLYNAALHTHGFLLASYFNAPAGADPGAPTDPYAGMSGPYTNAFRTLDDDTLFTQSGTSLAPYAFVQVAALTQHGDAQDVPAISRLQLWAGGPPS